LSTQKQGLTYRSSGWLGSDVQERTVTAQWGLLREIPLIDADRVSLESGAPEHQSRDRTRCNKTVKRRGMNQGF